MTQATALEELDEERLTHEQIEKRAFEIYQRHDGENGHELEDWLIAEEEVRQRSKGGSQRRKP